MTVTTAVALEFTDSSVSHDSLWNIFGQIGLYRSQRHGWCYSSREARAMHMPQLTRAIRSLTAPAHNAAALFAKSKYGDAFHGNDGMIDLFIVASTSIQSEK